jgi:hypothetical protein
VSTRTISQSMKSIEGCYETPAQGANQGFRAPQARRANIGVRFTVSA